MLIVWAMAVMLSVHAAALVDVIPSPSLHALPVPMPPVRSINNPVLPSLPLNVVPRGPSVPKSHASRKQPAGTTGGKCSVVAKYFVSEHELKNYLNATMPEKIEEILLCEKVDMAGALGTVLTTLKSLDVGSLTSSLSVVEGLGVGGVLGKGGSSSRNSQKVPLVSNVLPSHQNHQSRQPAGGAKNKALNNVADTRGLLKVPSLNALNDITGTLGVPKVSSSVNDVVDKVSELKESTNSVLKKAGAPGVKHAVSDLLSTGNVAEMLLSLKVTKVTVENVNLATIDGVIQVNATATVAIGGEGLVGSVISIVGFEVDTEVSLTVGISTNNTQCPTLQIQDKVITAKEVKLRLVETVTESLPLPLPIPVPLDDTVAKVLTVELNSQNEDSGSCDIAFSDFNDCKNSTGIFNYEVKVTTLFEDGISVLYCAHAVLKGKSIPVPGSRLPPNPKNANISLTLSHNLLRAVVTHVAKLSSVSKDDLHTTITKITYSYKKNKIHAKYSVNIKRNGETIAIGKTTLTLSRDSRISNNKLITNLELTSAEHSVIPSEAVEDVKEVMSRTLQKFHSAFKGTIEKMNVPPGLRRFPINNAKVVNINLDLQAAN